jgi:hypothetical protein
MNGRMPIGVLAALGLLLACDGRVEGPSTEVPEVSWVSYEVIPPIRFAAPVTRSQQTRRVAITASGEDEESAQSIPAEVKSRGDVALEPDVWDPNAFIRTRRRMTVQQLDRAIRDATGGIGWDDADDGYGSSFNQLAPTLGVPDYFSRVQLDLTPGMTFQKFLNDGANVVCSTLINHEQQLPPEERVFFVHIDPGTNPVNDSTKTDANIKMLLLRFHGKSYALDGSQIAPWRDLVNTIAANAGPWWGDWLEAWVGMCVALLKHPDFYSY